MTRKNKIIAFILIAAVFFAAVLSLCVSTHNAEHDCVGSGCQICQQIESARQNLKILMSGIRAVATALMLVGTIYQLVSYFAQDLLQGTLVALKVKLLN